MPTLFLIDTEDGVTSLPHAVSIAKAYGDSLTVLCISKATSRKLTEVQREDPDCQPLPARILASLLSHSITATPVYDCQGPDTHRAVLDAANELDATRLVIHASSVDRYTSRGTFIRRLARSAPYDVIVLDPGGMNRRPKRVVVPQLKGGAVFALRLAARVWGNEPDSIVALADPKALPRSKRTFKKITDKATDKARAALAQTEDPHPLLETLEHGIDGDYLVLIDAEEHRQVPSVIAMLKSLREKRPDTVFAVALVRAKDAAGPGIVERWFENVRHHAPTLHRDERKSLHERMIAGGRLSTDFGVMLTLSTAIAALGLIQNSTAVVIGAMLVAPLMTPLVAIGMALVQQNLELFRAAGRAMIVGTAWSLFVSIVIGSLSPWGDLSAEVVARGGPNLFDLGIALLSGIAAAYALARPGVTGTLVGVAIAVALVPPLAAIGIAIAKWEPNIAIGAAVLFTTNLFAIVLGAAITFQFFGLGISRKTGDTLQWVLVTVILLSVGMSSVAGNLIYNLNLQMHEGVQRAYSRPLPPAARAALTARVAAESNAEILSMSQSNIEHGFGVQVVVVAYEDTSPNLADDLEHILTTQMGGYHKARAIILRTEPTPKLQPPPQPSE
ncbi:MAG: DUF389 domain-containing protein [Phycisphaeraceae bacterium]